VTAFDILFILLFVAVVGSLLYALAAAATGHRSTAGKLLRRLAATVLAYLAVVYVVAVLSSGRVLALDENKCSDDWCIAVSGVREGSDSSARMYDVTFRLSSRARRISQRERGVVVYMRDANGHRYDGKAGLLTHRSMYASVRRKPWLRIGASSYRARHRRAMWSSPAAGFRFLAAASSGRLPDYCTRQRCTCRKRLRWSTAYKSTPQS
jgi:hypothetical protein